MKRPTLRQVNGFVIIVNTCLPAIVLLTVGLMIWSTASAIKSHVCAVVGYAPTAFNEPQNRQEYVAAADDKTKTHIMERIARELPRQQNQTCLEQPWYHLRQLLAKELYGDTIDGLSKQMASMNQKLQNVSGAVSDRIPSVPFTPLKRVNLPVVLKLDVNKPLNGVIDAINSVPTKITNGLGDLGTVLVEELTAVVEPERGLLKLEIQKADYKRAVAWAFFIGFLSDIAALLTKFYWLFGFLAVWLVLSYGLWFHRRLSVGLALLRDEVAV